MHVHNLFGHFTFRLGDSEGPTCGFIDHSLELFGQECSHVVARANLDAAVTKLASREAEWMDHTITVDTHLAGAIRTIEKSSSAWLGDQLKFRDLAAAVRTLGETMERQVESSAKVAEILRGMGTAPLRPESSLSDAPCAKDYAEPSPLAATAPMFPEI